MNELITLDCEQGSDKWRQARLGIPTASRFKEIVTASGKASASAEKYMLELIAERITGKSLDGYTSDAMQRGTELEPFARAAYEFETGNDVQEIGGVFLDETRQVMASPDGLIPELRKGLEIKCPGIVKHMMTIRSKTIPAEYVMQVQGALWVTGYDEWDFVSYHPEYHPQPVLIIPIKRNERIIASLDKHVREFVENLNKKFDS